MAVPSLPPEAQRDPSGETADEYTTPVWPTRLVRSLQLLRFQTLTSLSQPAETMSGIFAEGEKPTQLTQSVCISSTIVYLHSARVFQSLMVLSRLPDTICLLSPEKATLKTSLVCPWNVRAVAPVFKSHKRMVLSQEAERANWPSEERTTSCTHSLWPPMLRRAYPGLPSVSEFRSQTMSFLSREQETTMLLCSYVVAM